MHCQFSQIIYLVPYFSSTLTFDIYVLIQQSKLYRDLDFQKIIAFIC